MPSLELPRLLRRLDTPMARSLLELSTDGLVAEIGSAPPQIRLASA